MLVGRTTRILGFSVAPEIAEEYDRLAQRQKKSKSELFRQMVESYKAKLDEEEFFRLQARMARRAQKKRIFTEKEVEKIVFEDR
jgi:metal-responsive CopG/Arc/MetJ family transcriptional regulator